MKNHQFPAILLFAAIVEASIIAHASLITSYEWDTGVGVRQRLDPPVPLRLSAITQGSAPESFAFVDVGDFLSLPLGVETTVGDLTPGFQAFRAKLEGFTADGANHGTTGLWIGPGIYCFRFTDSVFDMSQPRSIDRVGVTVLERSVSHPPQDSGWTDINARFRLSFYGEGSVPLPEVPAVPEPSTYYAGLGALTLLAGSCLRSWRR